MNHNTTKQWLPLLALAALGPADAYAQKLTLSDVKIAAGETATVTLSLESENNTVYGFQTKIVLPKGLTFEGRAKGLAGCFAEDDEAKPSATINASNGNLGVLSLDGYAFRAETDVLTFTVKAADDFVNARGALVSLKTSGTKITTSATGDEKAATAEATATVEAEYNAYEAGDVITFAGAGIGNGIRTYAKDIKEGEVSGMQPVTTWAIAENGDARAAGLFAQGSTAWLGSEDFTAPDAGTDLLGILAVWTAKTQYTMNIVLPAGEYWLPIKVWNTGGYGQFEKNLIGFVAEDGTEYLAQRTYYTPSRYGATEELIHFAIEEETRGYITLGYTAVNEGSSSMPHLFIEPIQILDEDPTPVTPDPVIPFADGNYYLRNVATGLYLGAANNWGTQASLTQHADYVTLHKVADGVYTIESRVSNGDSNYFFTNPNEAGDTYMDGAAAQVTFNFTDRDGLYTITNGDATFGYDGEQTALSSAATGENALWEVIPEADMLQTLSGANKDNPVDATFLIKDPNFSRNNRDKGAWTVSEGSNNNLQGGDNSNTCAESYHTPFTISQTIYGVRYGTYRINAQGFYRQDGDDSEHLPEFFANDATAAFPLMGELPDYDGNGWNSMGDASVEFSAGKYAIEPIYFEVTDGTINLGTRLAENKSLWVIWDNFELAYYGDSTTPADAELADIYNSQIRPLLDEAQTILNSTDRDDVKQLLGWAQDFDNFLLEPNKEAYLKFVADATEQIAEARALIDEEQPAELDITELTSAIDELLAFISDNADSYTIDDEALAETVGALNALKDATYGSEDDIEAAQAALVAATFAFFDEITPTAAIDVTGLFVENATPTTNADGWEVTNAEGEPASVNAFDPVNNNAEFWRQMGHTIAQNIVLPAGSYKLTAQAFTRSAGEANGYTFDDMQAVLAAGDAQMNVALVAPTDVNSRTEGAAWFDAGNGVNELPFTMSETGEVTISLTADPSQPDAWLVWRSFKIELMPVTEPEPQPEPVAGDFDGDGEVDVTDYRTLCNYLLDLEGEADLAYDVNGDGRVNVADLTAIVNIIAYGDIRGATVEVRRAGNAFAIELSGASTLNAFQIDLDGVSPADVSLGSAAAGHELMTRTLSDGTLRVVVASTANTAFGGGTLLYVGNAAQARNIVFANAQAEAVYPGINATAINALGNASANGGETYDLAGRRADNVRGIAIVRQADGTARKVVK